MSVSSTNIVTPWAINADAGAPAYSAETARRVLGGLIRADDPADPLAHRPGVLSAGALVVSLDGSTIQVEPGPAVVGTISAGVYVTGLSAQNTDLTVTAADLVDARKDRVSLQVLDDDVDSGGERKGQVVYEAGTPGSGVYPDVPDNAVSLALVDVPASGGGSPVVTDDRARTTCAGGVLWVPTTTARDLLTADGSTQNPILVYVAGASAGARVQVCDDGATWQVLTAAGGSWTAWTPTVSGWTLGNGTVQATYQRVGALISARVCVTVGSTTSIGGSGLQITPPVAGVTAVRQVGSAEILDASTSDRYAGAVELGTGGTLIPLWASNNTGKYTALTSTVPTGMTWATGDIVYCNLVYEAAP